MEESGRAIFAPNLFEDRIVLVTGGGTGIGFAIAQRFGRLGARVVLAARDADRLRTAAEKLIDEEIDAYYHPVNIRDENSVEKLFDHVLQEHGVPDILVNNAGGQFEAEALGISPNGFRAVVDLNLNGTWLMSSAFARRVVEGKHSARIVNIVLVCDTGAPGMVHSGAARAGVINMTKTLAREWGPHGILINAVAPGTIETPGLDQYDKDALRAAVERLAVPRMGTPAEVATAVAFLASPGGDYITGEVLSVDGGEHLVGG